LSGEERAGDVATSIVIAASQGARVYETDGWPVSWSPH